MVYNETLILKALPLHKHNTSNLMDRMPTFMGRMPHQNYMTLLLYIIIDFQIENLVIAKTILTVWV